MDNLTINVGQLQSVASVYANVSKGLLEFNHRWASGHKVGVTWDMTNLTSGHINMTAVSFFLAIAHRVKLFTEQRQTICIDWHPKQFSFLADIGFFKISDEYDLFDWPFEIGGYEINTINPNTKILAFDQIYSSPNYNNAHEIAEWKKVHREQYRREIINRCESLLSVGESYLSRDLPLIMSRTCAELVTNSLLWGNSTSFLALQRSKKSISISVIDIGRGFRSSLGQKNGLLDISASLLDDISAIAIGSVINQNDFGLKRAISTVIELGGTISITSNSGEIHWASDNWNKHLNILHNYNTEHAISSLSSPLRKATPQDRADGFTRTWSNSIRGTRIEFNIPLREKFY